MNCVLRVLLKPYYYRELLRIGEAEEEKVLTVK